MASQPTTRCTNCRRLKQGKCKHCKPSQVRPDNRKTANQRGYNARWQKARLDHLEGEPLCRACKARGRTTAGTVVDHIVPHRGDYARFWDRANWQTLCAHHHAVKTGRGE